MKKAVVTDLDGTLLNSNYDLSEFTKKTMKKLLKKGYKLYIATGRIESGARLISNKISKKLPLVTANGTRILNDKNIEIFSIYIPEQIISILVNTDYKKFGEEIYINGYSKKEWYITSDERLNSYFKDKKNDYCPKLITEEEFKNKKYNKIYFSGKHENLKKLKIYLDNVIKKNANIEFVSKRKLEIYSKEISKVKGILKLLEKDNINPKEVIAFGDGMNDFEMLNFFEDSYIMENSLDELKKMLPNKEIIGNNNDDSVAKKILEIFKL